MMGNNFWNSLAGKLKGVGGEMSKTASKKTLKDVFSSGRVPLKEAQASGFFKKAAHIGWGLYKTEEIDGGLGGIWYVEKDAEGNSFLVKQIDPAGDIVRQAKTGGVV